MTSVIENLWDSALAVPNQVWHWFSSLSQEEWLIVLVVVCACGFMCMLGFSARRT